MEEFAQNPAFMYRDTVALYIEGIKCRYVSLQMMTEEGAVPYLSITVPATAELRHVSPRARVHLLAVEPVAPYNVVVLGEFEITARGFEKTTDYRNLTFTAVHVAAHLDQYEITTLDTATAVRALAGAGNLAGTQVSAPFTGNVLELLNTEQLTADLREFAASASADTALAATSAAKTPARAPNSTRLTVRDVVLGTFLLYRKIFRNSRVSDTYTSVAVDMHQLIARFQFPDPELLDWSDIYAKLMAQLLLQGPQQSGGAQTFLDVVRGICQFFLHSVNVVPNAESVTKQIQVKPLTHFNAVPNCNVFFNSLVGAVSLKEDFAAIPTRLQTMFAPLGTAGEFDLTLFQRELTMFAPAELQYLWRRILDATATGTSAPPKNTVKRALTFFKPADGVPFVTQEEDRRGVVTMQYTVPPLLNTVVLSQTLSAPQGGDVSGLVDIPSADAPVDRDFVLTQQLFSAQEADRRTKYLAFLCIALGDGGLDARDYPTARDVRKSIKYLAADAQNEQFVPNRITLVPSSTRMTGSTLNRDAARATGANYVILADGTVAQARARRSHLFEEPSAVPYGVRLEGSNTQQDHMLNATTPPLGKSYEEWQGAVSTYTATYVPAAPMAPTAGTVRLTFFFQSGTNGILVPSDGWSPSQADPVTWENLADFEEKTTRVQAYITLPEGGKATGTVLAVHTQENGDLHVARVDIQLAPGSQAITQGRVNVTFRPVRQDVMLKPWFFCQAGSAWHPSTVKAAYATRSKAGAEQAVSSNFGLPIAPNTGNEQNLVIAVDVDARGSVTKAQATALARLIATVQELQTTSVGSGANPQKQGRALPVAKVNSYFGSVPMPTFNGLPDFKGLEGLNADVETFRNSLFKEFNTWDKGLTSSTAKFIPLSAANNVDATAYSEGIPDSTSTQQTGSTESTETTVQSFTAAALKDKKIVSLSVPEFNEITYGYLRGFLNYQFYAARVASHSLSVTLPFHPYATVGYPAIVLDSTGTGYDLIGYVHAVVHEFNPTGAQTTIVLTHTRRTIAENAADVQAFEEIARAKQTPGDRAKRKSATPSFSMLQREAMIPFSKTLVNQFVLLAPINSGTIMGKLGLQPLKGKDGKPLSNLAIARDPELYYKYLERLSRTADKPCLIPSTFLPIQLHDLETKLPPIFVYDGGFGLGKVNEAAARKARSGLTSSMRNFDTYAVYVGYNQGLDNQKPLAAESNFVFADTIDSLPRTLTPVQALEFNRRGIQRLGQNDLTAATASLVDYASREDAQRVAGDTDSAATASTVPKTAGTAAVNLPTGAKGVPDQIVVYKEPPIYSNGRRVKEGAVLVFDNNIRNLVLKHNLHVRRSDALPNEE